MLRKNFIITLLSFMFTGCITINTGSQYDQMATSRNQNVCGHLKDDVMLYAIFVDVNDLHPFTKFDIQSTIDSVEKACKWISDQAEQHEIHLKLNHELHSKNNKWSFNEKRAYAKLSINKSISGNRKSNQQIMSWADQISTYTGKRLKPQNRTNLGSKINIKSTEQLIARLRDQFKTDNIALMIFINGYFENIPSISFNTYNAGPNVEFSVITKKNPAIIAHELLHLFGAIDLYPNRLHANFNYAEIAKEYPNEIMRITHKPIEDLQISPITRYYLGWAPTLDKENTRLLYHLSNVTEY